MKKQLRKLEKILEITNTSLVDLPTPKAINYMWNMGSMLAACLVLQIMTGIMISMQYMTATQTAFETVMMISRNITGGHSLRMLHSTGASLFFLLVYLHMTRGLLNYSPNTKLKTWTTGITILVLLMGTAFLGYVLPWGQMSFWGASVITNIMSAIPYLGKTLVEWLWGGFSVNQPTLTRFFSLHFLLPMVLTVMVMLHLMMLHEAGSSNPLGKMFSEKVSFHPFFSTKDLTPILILFTTAMIIVSHSPESTLDPENFSEANPLVTPTHIQPEWYFLFAYAILRSIPSKLGGMIALAASILVFLTPSVKTPNMTPMKFLPSKKIMTTIFISSAIVLSWIGANPVEIPFETIGQIQSIIYFLTITLVSTCFLKI